MKIYTSPYNGFCAGVRKAVDLALNCHLSNVYSLGEIVHNDFVTDKIADKGIVKIENINELRSGDNVIIRAHGASKEIFRFCNDFGINIIDATCAYVRIIQQKAELYFNQGYQIVLIGEATHPEIIGVNGWCENSAIIFSGEGTLDLNSYEKVLIMFQTTFQHSKVEKILKNIKTDNIKTVEIFNTICYTTIERQRYVDYLADLCEFCIIVGSPTSANSKQLFQIASRKCKNTYFINTAQEISSIKFLADVNIALISGASTPQELMEEVTKQMVVNSKDNETVVVEVNEFTKAVDKMASKSRPFHRGMKLKGTISHKDADGISVSVGTKKDGFVPNSELCLSEDFQEYKDSLKVGDPIEVCVHSTENALTLSKKAIDELYKDDQLVDGIKNGEEFSITVAKAVKGGLLSKLGSYTVFIPSSHIRNGFVKNLEQYVGKKLRLIALEDGVDESKKKIVASQKQILLAEKKDKEDNFWNNIEVGEIIEGKVLRFAPFGAFVGVRGYDCLAHLSDLSWNNIKAPSDVLELNKTYEFVVLKLDREANRVSIGFKQLQPQPWQLAEQHFPAGSIVKGKVVRLLPFGAFVELADGIDGLLHISNVCWEWLDDINKALKIGDEVEVAVIGMDVENKRITLSRKALLQQPEGLQRQDNDEGTAE